MISDHSIIADALNEQVRAISRLQRELDTLRGDTFTPRPGCELFRASLGAASVWLECQYTRSEPDRPNADAANPGPGHPASVDILGVLINGILVNPTDFAPPWLIDRWEEAILLSIGDS